LLDEIVFEPSDLKPSQHSIDDNRLGGIEIEDWPNWKEEFEHEFKKPCLDLEVKYKKPTKDTKAADQRTRCYY
jgi:hypothetical protein